MSEDPFGTASLRERVLAAWAASPDRFREDANAEEDLAYGGYRGRLVVELAQNAADAAARAGGHGRLLLRLAETPDGPLLVAANTGRPLDAAGVRALASLRASAKRNDTAAVGRFGVGFAAVLAVTDEPAVVSRAGGVRFSRGDTLALVRAAAADAPELAAELERRDQHVPALRLPFPAQGVAPSGYATAVLLPLRDGAAEDLVARLLAEVDDALLLALPGLAEVVVELPGQPAVRHADAAERWHPARRAGVHAPELLADRPTEERARPAWCVTWALPRDRQRPGLPSVLYAPTPTDEPLQWPALLIATFPLDPTRRHVVPGPATDALVSAAAGTFCELLRERAETGDDVLPLVPAGLPAGALDGQLRHAVLDELPAAPLLRAAEDGRLLRPRDAVALEGSAGEDGDALRALAPVVAGLVAAPRRAHAALTALRVRRLPLADVVEQLPADADPGRWRQRYGALAPLAADPLARESLAALPVPLADGRVVRGVRGVWLVAGEWSEESLAPLAAFGLRVVHPVAAAEPSGAALLERLGARRASARQLLDDPALRAAVEAAADTADGAGVGEAGQDVVRAVLGVVRAAVRDNDLEPGDRGWLADLPLDAVDGEPAPAAALVLPGSVAASLLDSEEVTEVAGEVLQEWGRAVLEAVGVARTLGVVRATDVDVHDLPDELDVLDGLRAWAAQLPPGTVAEVVALRDLDLVRDDAWPQALAVIGDDRVLREAVAAPATVSRPDGGARRAPSYSAWWLRRRLGTTRLADPAADPRLARLLRPAPGWVVSLDAGMRAALGVVRGWDDLDGDGWRAVLDGMADVTVDVGTVLAAWRALAVAASVGGVEDLDPPPWLRVPGPGGSVVAPADRVAVVDSPMWLQRDDVGPLLPVPPGSAVPLADLLDLDLAAERAAGVVDAGGTTQAVPGPALEVLPAAPTSWQEHDVLRVDGVEVDWWVEGDGRDGIVHAATLAGLARALAQAAGQWGRRLAVEAVLVDPAAEVSVLVEEAMVP